MNNAEQGGHAAGSSQHLVLFLLPLSLSPRIMTEGELLSNIKSWQAGELVLHHKLSVAWRGLTAYPPPERHVFPCSTSNLPFLPVTTLDACGRPWTSILAGADGKTGFTTHSPCKTELEIAARLWEGEPLYDLSQGTSKGKNNREVSVSGIGIDLKARKCYRNFVGTLVELSRVGEGVKLRLRVNQSLRYARGKHGLRPKLIMTIISPLIGRHCPKYMTIRDLVPHANTKPTVLYSEVNLRGHLPEDAIISIRDADTVFLGVSYATDTDIAQAPVLVETSICSGRPGFVRVSPSDGRTIVLPEFSGTHTLHVQAFFFSDFR
jgi:hypothetical protein